MRAHLWKLEGKVPVPCSDVIEWGKWFENMENRRVAMTDLGNGVIVYTSFLGLDHNYSPEGEPLVFETLPKGLHGPDTWADEMMDRYSTWEQAEKGHARVVRRVKAVLARRAQESTQRKIP